MKDFFNQTDVIVEVTYTQLGLEKPFRFPMRLFLSKEDQAVRQKYLGLTDAEKDAMRHTHNVEILSLLCSGEPENVPNFPTDDKPLKERIISFFSGDNQMKHKVANDVITLYYNKSQPKEFFRSF